MLVARILVSGFFILGGLAHLLVPEMFMKIMPDYLPMHAELVLVSGVLEISGGVLIWIRALRRLAGVGLIVLCVLVFPANVNMAINHAEFTSIPVWLLYLRLPFQGVIIYMIYWAMQSDDSIQVVT